VHVVSDRASSDTFVNARCYNGVNSAAVCAAYLLHRQNYRLSNIARPAEITPLHGLLRQRKFCCTTIDFRAIIPTEPVVISQNTLRFGPIFEFLLLKKTSGILGGALARLGHSLTQSRGISTVNNPTLSLVTILVVSASARFPQM